MTLYCLAMVPFLHVGSSLPIPTFGLMVACAMLAAYFVLRADLARRGIADKNSGEAEALVSFPCLAGFVGAKLYHLLESPAEFFADPLHLLFSPYGFAWFGGLLAGFAAFAFVAWRITRHNAAAGHRVSLLSIFDAGSPAAALGYGIGRIGCLLSGDGDYGIPTSLPWGMSFPNGLVPTVERVHPTPIYEFIVACAIAWWLWRMGATSDGARTAIRNRTSAERVHHHRPGEVFRPTSRSPAPSLLVELFAWTIAAYRSGTISGGVFLAMDIGIISRAHFLGNVATRRRRPRCP